MRHKRTSWPSRPCEICGNLWSPRNRDQAYRNKTCSLACAVVTRSNLCKIRWQDPDYRALHAERLRKQAEGARAIALEVRRNKPQLPPRNTPEFRYYRKMRKILGSRIAREALGVGR